MTNLEGNRSKEYFQRVKKRTFTVFLYCFLFFLIIEIFSISILYLNMIVKKRNTELFFYQYGLTNTFVMPFLQKNHYLTNSKQKYIGIISVNALDNNWGVFMPPDTILGWRNGRNIKVIHDTSDKSYIYLTNEQGFLSTGQTEFYISHKKPPNTYRIFVVGGSAVMGEGAYTPDENLPAQILRYLKDSGKTETYEVINAGVGGYNSAQELLYIMSELVYYKPDLIIIYDGWNDSFYNNLLLDKYGEAVFPLKTLTHYQLDKRLEGSYTLKGSTMLFLSGLRNFLYKKIDRLATWHLMRRGGVKLCSLITKKSIYDTKEKKYNPKSVKMYKENLEKIIMVCKLYDIKVALFLQPIMGVDRKKLTSDEKILFNRIDKYDIPVRVSFYNDARLMFENLKSKYNEKSKVCIRDLSLLFENIKETVYVDSGHSSLLGNQIIAQEIVNSIREGKL